VSFDYAANASPVGFVHELALECGESTEITRQTFFEYGARSATAFDKTIAGTAAQVADTLEEAFEATGSRGVSAAPHRILRRYRPVWAAK